MPNRTIKKATVLGSGVMGSRIACHLANVGVEVLLLDIVPKELNESEKAKKLTLEDKVVRNRIAFESLQAAIHSNPPPLYVKKFSSRIKIGNMEDDISEIKNSDWIIEAVVENLAIKKSVFEIVEKYRKQGTIVSSNTSGIPIKLLAEGRSEDFRKNFLITHFFNPPRYLQLLEIVPCSDTSPELVKFMLHYGDLILGKETILCKDTPAFIANRIGIFSIMNTINVAQELSLTVEDVDNLTGPLIGRPKSATFRTADVVGIDTLVKVSENLYHSLPKDEKRSLFEIPDFIQKMVEMNLLGEKSGKGFYNKIKNERGESEILSLDLEKLIYRKQAKTSFSSLNTAKSIENLKERLKFLVNSTDKAGQFFQKIFFNLFSYVSFRIPEIADELYAIDAAMKSGFGWEMGPFEIWDSLGVSSITQKMRNLGYVVASWVDTMIESGNDSFYKIIENKLCFYCINSHQYKAIPGSDTLILLNNTRQNKIVWQNKGCSLHDIGDGILNLEFHSKMNTIGSEVIEGINKAIAIAEKDFAGLVIANDGTNFSAGANLAILLMYALEQEWDEINFMVSTFQKTMMRIRYSSIPVVVAPHALTLGGGCELTLHADAVQASAELYMGLVEFGVGLIPAGGGTKEMVLRLSDAYEEGDIQTNSLRNYFLTIAQAKVSSSAHEAFELGFLRRGDQISMNRKRQIKDAKELVLKLYHNGYMQPLPRKDIKVLGKTGLGIIQVGAYNMYAAGYITEYDKYLSEKLGYVMCGGDLSSPSYVSENYLLELERETFLHLCGQKKTLERIQHMLNTGKPLRN